MIALAAVGLIAADFATYSSLRSFLISRTDNSLQQAHLAAGGALRGPPPGDHHPAGRGVRLDRLLSSTPGDYVQLRRLNGKVVFSGVQRLPGSDDASVPLLPKTIDLPAASGNGDRVRYFTVSATQGGERYRVRASIEPDAPMYMLLIAAPLHDVDSTLNRLLWIELLVTAAVLAGIAAVGLWVVRLSLRPLDAIGATAAAIASCVVPSHRACRRQDRGRPARIVLERDARADRVGIQSSGGVGAKVPPVCRGCVP